MLARARGWGRAALVELMRRRSAKVGRRLAIRVSSSAAAAIVVGVVAAWEGVKVSRWN